MLALDIPLDAGNNAGPSQFFLMSLSVFASGFLITIGYQPGSGPAIPVCTALVPSATHVPGTVYAMGGIGAFADSVGKVVVGRLANIELQPQGSFTFTVTTARVEPDCVRPIIQGVTSLAANNGTSTSAPLYGDIILEAGDNMQLTPVVVAGQDPVIIISAVQGEGLSQNCVCTGDTTGTCVQTVNGIPPTPDGNLSILGSACLEVNPIANGLQLVDTCSQPCCGCAELEAITQQLELFGSKANTLQGFINGLQSSVNTMNTTVLGSKLSDLGCTVCT